jgi:uncharacterized protein YegP (UPF0339 family)
MNFYVYVDSALKWRWRLRARNGKILADSGQGYHEKRKCLYAVGLLRSLSSGSAVHVGRRLYT